jgi:hypothetical protein
MAEAASGIDVTVYALYANENAEEEFRAFLRTHQNAHFATQTSGGRWRVHRLHCSSLDFSGAQRLTASPKVCALREEDLNEWAHRFGVATTECSRCRQPK